LNILQDLAYKVYQCQVILLTFKEREELQKLLVSSSVKENVERFRSDITAFLNLAFEKFR